MTIKPTILAPVWALLVAYCAWATFLPVGAKYLALLGSALVALVVLQRQHRLGELRHDRAFIAAAAFYALTLISVLWSSGAPHEIGPQLWLYAMLLLSPLIALACPPELARFGLRQFALAAAVVGGAVILARVHALPEGWVWASSVEADGNQRIVTSLMLALGATMAVQEGLRPAVMARVERGAWLAGAVIAGIGLALQDRRTGMVALPVLLAVYGLARLRSVGQRAAVVVAVIALCGLAWAASPVVRAHIGEGLHEMQTYESSDRADTSWGMRLRLAEHTIDMIRERPLLGHGVASWLGQWRQRVTPGLWISRHLTPHNEYLQVAAQLGAAGIVLLLWLLLGNAAQAWRAGPDGHAALLVWTAIAWTGFFNVVIRDSKFALPLLMLAGLAGAVSRNAPRRR